MPKPDKPRYRCRECDHEWEERVAQPTECPQCGHLWLNWLNYEDLRHLSTMHKGRPWKP